MSDTPCGMVAMPLERALVELTATERRALTICKFTYAARAAGFSVPEARRLVFCRFLFDTDHIGS